MSKGEPLKSYLEALRKYAVFEGRTSRKEFWQYCLFWFINFCVLGMIDGVTGLHDMFNHMGFLSFIYVLLTVSPTAALSARRLHDANSSGWWALLLLIPLVGIAIIGCLSMRDGNPSDNQYGPKPRDATI
jgi:uncharacterized membrane protein YhaH (DUF805 family)